MSAPARRPFAFSFSTPAAREPSLFSEGVFEFLGTRGALAEIGWDGPAYDKLWRYNQHYFDDLNAWGASERSAWHDKLLLSWVEENPPAVGVGWEPYPTSLRIVNWVKWALADHVLPDDCLDSLATQTTWLCRRLEWHLLGNHLFSNAKALVFAGLFFEGEEANGWFRRGCRILERQISEQILADGGHFERSTMYHALALEDVLDLINIFRTYAVRGRLADLCFELELAAGRMTHWLTAMCHPDGEISFFNDAALGIAPSTQELLAYAARLGFAVSPPASSLLGRQLVAMTRLETSGYLRVDMPAACALLDVAQIGPDYLPGHAHADTLSFELSVLGERVFVNSGTSLYGVSEERLRQRGTAAHNTVIVAGCDSSQVWSGFRAARRAYPKELYTDGDDERMVVRCAHDGYEKLLKPPVTHRRVWHFEASRLLVSDLLQPARVAARHPAEARFHLHPAVRLVKVASANALLLALPGGGQVRVEASAPLQAVPSTYHPRFGVSESTTCLVLPLENGAARLTVDWSGN
jgi:uncharacterized heparinase superfamily protein